ncbi:MAG TPA: DUF1684 domain-containing protein [Edaphobacter sp.]|nr:DUF1684 domain-containing protein [Edaphobacter sp.]
MKKLLCLVFVALSATGQTNPGNAAYTEQIHQFRAQRAKNLSSPEGWLSLVALQWLKPGDTTVGSALGNTLQLDHAPAHLATFRLANDTVTLVPPTGGFPAGTTIDGKPSTSTKLSYDDNHPSELRNGGLLMIVIKRGDRLYLRVKDAQAPTRTNFHGLNWYASDSRYVVTAKWIPSNPPHSLTIPNVLGQISHEPSPGTAEFTINGQTVRLEPVIEDPADKTLFFIFRDTTSKTTTYQAGRFLYTSLPSNGVDKPGTIVLDFNRTQNPPCVYTAFATCPLPPQQNRLNIPIPAGEKRYHD